jgi:hypothetical protein
MERALGVLQKRFSIVCGPAKYWKPKVLGKIITRCFILHNMIIEDGPNMGEEKFWYISNGDPVEPEHDAKVIQRFLEAP